MPRFIYILILILLSQLTISAQDGINSYHSGLSFISHQKNQDERTGLNLTPEKAFDYPASGFSISFDLRLRDELHTYGYICRIVFDNSISFDIISHLLESKINFLLTDQAKTITSYSYQDSLKIVKDEWIPINLNFNKDNIIISIGEEQQTISYPFSKHKKMKIYYGANNDPQFYTNDVSPMTIKNIVIRDHKDNIKYQWDLTTHNQDKVYDQITHNVAIAKNPIWEINKHAKWKKLISIKLDTGKESQNSLPQIAYDNNMGKIFIVTRNRVYTYNVENNKIDTIIPTGGQPYLRVGSASQILYDNMQNRLISYNPDFSKLNYYDFADNKWSESLTKETDSYQHHNRLIDHQSNKLFTFGGYGLHKYNAELTEISLDGDGGWQKYALDTIIAPRYLSSLCQLDTQNILILGGYGSISGKQEESPRNFYDLYKINLKTKQCTPLWSFVNISSHYTFSNSMVADIDANKIYALTYHNDRYYSSLYLSSFDIVTNKPSINILSDTIKYNFLDVKSYCDLFLHKKTSSFFAIIQQESNSENSTTIDVYSLAYPPLSVADINNGGVSPDKDKTYFFLLFGIVSLLTIISTLYLFRKRRNKKRNLQYEGVHSPKILDIETSKEEDKPKSAIFLLGRFRVFDINGVNITSEFSPTHKQILIYLLLNSIGDGKGTTSQQLDETFWFGMDKSSAANNRRVNISKLRLLLQNIGKAEIINKNNYWILDLGEEISCDYKKILSLMKNLNVENINKEIIYQIIEVGTKGSLLPEIDAEWLDSYKSEFSVKLTGTLLDLLKHPTIMKDHRLSLKIADVLLIHDNIDEDAIRVKCSVLYQMKQKGLSKQSYNKFCEDYMHLLNTKPDFSYQDIIDDLTKS